MYRSEPERWRAAASAALAEPDEARASPERTRKTQRRINMLEPDVER